MRDKQSKDRKRLLQYPGIVITDGCVYATPCIWAASTDHNSHMPRAQCDVILRLS